MARHTAFAPGSLSRELNRRGLTNKAFAELAGIDIETLTRALDSRTLHGSTYGKIVSALNGVAPLEVPAGLLDEASA